MTNRGTPHSAPLVVSRACGLPVATLDELRTEETSRLVGEAEEQRDSAATVIESLSDDLYRLVPALEADKRARRAALRLRRDVHNLRLNPGTETAVTLVLPYLEPAVRDRLLHWRDTLRDASDRLGKARETIPAELAHAARALPHHLSEPSTALGLALASPGYAAELLGRQQPAADAETSPESHALDTWDSRRIRSAVAYLTRTALKPSPFSTLTTVSASGWHGEPAADPALATRALSSSRPAAMELLRAWAARPDAPAALRLLPNPSVRTLDPAASSGPGGKADTPEAAPQALAALPMYCHTGGVFLREDEITACGPLARQLSVLPTDQPLHATEVADVLNVDSATVARLVDTGALLPVTPWSLSEGRHFTAFARHIDGAEGPVADTVRTLADLEERVATAEDGLRRATDVERARGAVCTGLRTLRRRVPDWLASVGMMHEVAAHGADHCPPLGDAVRADLHEVGATLRPRVRRVALYQEMVRSFVGAFGVGGSADLLAFCYRFLNAAPTPWWHAMLGRPAEQSPSDAELRGHRTVAPAGHTVFFQVAAESREQVAAGEHLLVVNRIHSSLAGLVGRWACVPALHDRLDETLTDWLTAHHPGCRVYQISAHADWIEFQRPALTGLPRAGWGPDLADQDSAAVDLRGFTLTHHPASDTLQLTDASGAPAALAYLGSVPPLVLRGVDRILATLSDPWTTLLPGEAPTAGRAGTAGHTAETPGDGDVTRLPRQQRGRLVFRRATWRMPAACVPRPDSASDPVAFLADVERWRRRHHIPDEVFVTRHSARPGVAPDKPQWVGFAHPHVVCAAFRQITDDTATVELAEALPGRRQHWSGSAAQPPFATEFTGMVRHD